MLIYLPLNKLTCSALFIIYIVDYDERNLFVSKKIEFILEGYSLDSRILCLSV